MVARSRSHSSPGCVPTGVIFTFSAQAGAPAAESASASMLIPKCFIRMMSSLALFKARPWRRSIERRTIGLLFHIVGDKIIPLIDRFICRAAMDHGGIFLLSNEFLDAGLVFAYGLVELVCFLLGLDLSSLSWLAT